MTGDPMMTAALDIWQQPDAKEVYMVAGWRQWADAGSISSALPRYLIKQTGARQIGALDSTGYYLFQIPGTHGLVRPVVNFDEGYPKSLQAHRNEFYYAGSGERGLVIFLGDEPHQDVDRYVASFLDAAESMGVRRIVGLGGVFGELPHDKQRAVSAIYSMRRLRAEVENLAVDLSDYQGGASIGSVVCHVAKERKIEYVGLYGFVPTYDFSQVDQIGNTIRVENDFLAWLGIMRRINYMLKVDIDLADLEEKSAKLVEAFDEKLQELDETAPQLGVRDYVRQLEADFEEVVFEPLDEVWEEELRRLFDENESPE
jgi:proteasome assembly chaperone (PAC2) family protein